MPVLVEGFTILLNREVLERRSPGALAAVASEHPAEARCDDGQLVALRVPWPIDLAGIFRELSRRGVELFDDDETVDIALVEQGKGLLGWCRWLELAYVTLPGGERVLAARTKGTASTAVALPPGWQPAQSPTRTLGSIPLRPTDRPLDFVRREPGASVYLDRFTGEEVRVALPDPPAALEIVTTAGATHQVVADVVREPEAVELGLMHRDRLEPDAGMLFLYEEPGPLSFWMKNTRIPLDMLFLSADGVVVELGERVAPMSLRGCTTRRPCQAVLEVNAGWAAAHGVGRGARVRWPARPWGE